jgi:hypothetical protein
MREKAINYALVKLAIWICTSKALNFVHCVSFRHMYGACHSIVISMYQAGRRRASLYILYVTMETCKLLYIHGGKHAIVIGQTAAEVATDGSGDLISLCFTLTGKQILDNYRKMCYPRRTSRPDKKVTGEMLFYVSLT